MRSIAAFPGMRDHFPTSLMDGSCDLQQNHQRVGTHFPERCRRLAPFQFFQFRLHARNHRDAAQETLRHFSAQALFLEVVGAVRFYLGLRKVQVEEPHGNDLPELWICNPHEYADGLLHPTQLRFF